MPTTATDKIKYYADMYELYVSQGNTARAKYMNDKMVEATRKNAAALPKHVGKVVRKKVIQSELFV